MKRRNQKPQFLRIILGLLGLFSLVFLFSCTKHDHNEVVIGFNPAESADVAEVNGKALAKVILEKTGLKLKTFVASDYGALVEAMRSGKVHFAFLPPFSLIQAEKVAGAKVLLKAVRLGHARYYSVIFTAKDFSSIEELKGKSIAWTDPASTTGHIIAKSMLMDMKIDPDNFFGKQVFAGGHDAVVLAVLNKTVDAGATYADDPNGKVAAWTHYLKDKKQAEKIKVLKVSQPLPGDTLATTEDFMKNHKDTVDKLVNTMLNLSKTKEGSKALMDLYHMEAMVPAKSEDFEPIRQAARRLKIGEH